MILLRWLTFLLRYLTLTDLLFWIYFFLLTLLFVLQCLFLRYEILIILLSQFPLIFQQTNKSICRTVGLSLAASLEPLAHHQNVASLSFFYRYYFGRCSSELAQLVPLPFSQGKSTCYSDRLHDFSATFPRCFKDVHVNHFISCTARLEFSAYRMLSFDQ